MTEDRAQGIDVSHYQGVIDWTEVARAGIAFAFMKASDGIAGIDSRFHGNWTAAGTVGLRRGAYHFFRPQHDAEQQANHFLRTLGSDPGELPPVLDFELLGGAPVEQALRGATKWMAIVEDAYCGKPILYTGPAFWKNELASSSLLAEHPLWIAHYTKLSNPSVPASWKTWTFWQFSERGHISGVSGPVDLDCFAGSISELDAFCVRINKKSAAIGS